MEYLIIIALHSNGHLTFKPISDYLPKETCEAIASQVVMPQGSIYCVEKEVFIQRFDKLPLWESRNEYR